MSTPTRSSLQNEIVNRINLVCRYILSLPNYKDVGRPEKPIQILSLADSCGYLPIHYAIAAHDEFLFNSLVEIFLTFPTPMFYFNSPDRVGNTPIHWAIMRRNYQAVVVLVRCGADSSRMNDEGRTPLHLVVSQCGKNCSQTDLLSHHNMVKFLISVGAQVDSYDVNNVTPLHLAAELGDISLVESLVLEGGAFVNVIDDVGETPLFYALRGQHPEVIKKLIDLKANLFSKNDEGETPLEFCLSIRDDRMVELLSQFNGSPLSVSFNSPNLRSSISMSHSAGSSSLSSAMNTSTSESVSESLTGSSMDLDLSRSGSWKTDKDHPRIRANSREGFAAYGVGIIS